MTLQEKIAEAIKKASSDETKKPEVKISTSEAISASSDSGK